MKLRYLLDTDVLSLFQNDRGTVGRQIHAHIEQVGPDTVGTRIVTVEEQLQGRFAQIRRAETTRQGGDLCVAYAHLREAVELFRQVSIADYTAEAHDCFTQLRGKGRLTSQKVKTHDLRIGCIALAHSLIVVTGNRADFERIPGLQVEDWTRAE